MMEKPDRDWKDRIETIVKMGKYLLKLREEHPNENISNLALVDFAINESTIDKICKIASHHVLSNPANFDKLPSRWALLYELKFLPDELLIQKMNEGALLHIQKYAIWEMRGIKKRGPTVSNNKVVIPDNTSLVAYVHAGMQKEKEFGGDCEDADEVAKLLQIGVQTYRMIRSILVLSKRPELNSADRRLVDSVIDKINKSRNVRPHYEKVKPLIDKIWGGSTIKVLSEKLSSKRVDSYMNSVAILCDSCQSLLELEQPYLPSENIDKIILDLTEAGRLIRALAETLRRTKSE